MAYTETKTTSYGSRLGSSIKGIGAGFTLLVAGTVLLWWNEGRAVREAEMLDEAQGKCVHVADVSKVNPELEGQFIHAVAQTATTDTIYDPMFPAVRVNGVKLNRKVEYYQWVEKSQETKRDKMGGGQETVTTYSYEKKWTNMPQNSEAFHDPSYIGKNKVALPGVENKYITAENVTFGAYRLPKSLIGGITGDRALEIAIPEKDLREISENAAANILGTSVTAYKISETVTKAAVEAVGLDHRISYANQRGNTLYIGKYRDVPGVGKDLNAPEIGDMRITFTYVAPGRASVIAQVMGDSFCDYVAKNGHTLSVLTTGEKSMEQMFQSEQDSNSIMTWGLRLLGLLMVIGGFKSIFGILYMLFKVLPFLADIVEVGVGLVCSVLGFAWTLIVIAIAWLYYRPILTIILLAIVAAVVVFFVKRGRDKKKAVAAVEA